MARALVVDDHGPTASALAALLVRDGWEVDAFTVSDEALHALQRSSFEAVITDLHMPKVSGVDIARATRRYQPGACLVVVSGKIIDHEQLDLREICILASKPLDYRRLIDGLTACRTQGTHRAGYLLRP